MQSEVSVPVVLAFGSAARKMPRFSAATGSGQRNTPRTCGVLRTALTFGLAFRAHKCISAQIAVVHGLVPAWMQ
jgi:hypothetical protein